MTDNDNYVDGVGDEWQRGETEGIYIEGFCKILILFAEEIPWERILIKSLTTNQTET